MSPRSPTGAGVIGVNIMGKCTNCGQKLSKNEKEYCRECLEYFELCKTEEQKRISKKQAAKASSPNIAYFAPACSNEPDTTNNTGENELEEMDDRSRKKMIWTFSGARLAGAVGVLLSVLIVAIGIGNFIMNFNLASLDSSKNKLHQVYDEWNIPYFEEKKTIYSMLLGPDAPLTYDEIVELSLHEDGREMLDAVGIDWYAGSADMKAIQERESNFLYGSIVVCFVVLMIPMSFVVCRCFKKKVLYSEWLERKNKK